MMVAVDLGLEPESEAKNPNPNQSSITANEEDEDSWEVRMFEEDMLGCTWPPRSYTCTFCKRVFGSAQALGGHMNVHRRERARLNRLTRNASKKYPSSSSSSPSALIIPTQEFIASGNGLCLLYSFRNPNPNANPIMVPGHAMDPSTHRSFISISPPPPFARSGSSSVVVSSLLYQSSNREEVVLGLGRNGSNSRNNIEAATVIDRSSSVVVVDDEEIDLELRLGRRSSPP